MAFLAERWPVVKMRVGTSRQNLVLVYGALVFATVAFDPSIYVGGLAHVYLHDAIAAVVGVFGVGLAVESRSVLPRGRRIRVAIGLLGFLLANTALVGALAYPSVSPEMYKLFWFEHGNAVRIVGELMVWIWTLGHLAPTRPETRAVLDLGLWGCTVNVALVGTYWMATNARPVETTTFDLFVLAGLPLALMFVLVRSRRHDVARLIVFGAATTLLYSRSSIVGVAIGTLLMCLLILNWRRLILPVASIGAGWLIALVLSAALTSAASSTAETAIRTLAHEGPLTTSGNSSSSEQVAGAQVPIERAKSLVDTKVASYTMPNRIEIWKDAIRIFQMSPILGVGYHDYFIHSAVTEVKDASQLDIPDLFSSRIKQAHNEYLSWLAETGIVGLGIYVAFWCTVLFHAWQLWRRESEERAYHSFTVALMLSLLAVGLFGEILIPRMPGWVPSALMWWIAIGLSLQHPVGREERVLRDSH